MISIIIVFAYVVIFCSVAVVPVDAFVGSGSSPTISSRQRQKHNNLIIISSLHAENNEDDNTASDTIGGDLVTALAKLDKKWELARYDSANKIGDWTILDVKDEGSISPEIVYLLEPATGAIPSCVIFFLGGAVLGQFPHISYSTFLRKLAEKTNAAVVAIPYEVGLDHLGIAQSSVKRMKNALIQCEDSRGYPANIPKYEVGHSLGAKLHSIGIAATGIGEELAGLGCISYNNFGFAQTISMARSFAKELKVGGPGGFGPDNPAFDQLFDLAGMAVNAIGLEFTPSPMDMDKILQSKFDDEVLKKIRMFSFNDDDLDSTKSYLECFKEGSEVPTVSHLPGTHLTPVFLKLGLDDFIPDEEDSFVRDMANQATGGFKNASFGDEDSLDVLVEEVSGWMLGNPPNDRRAAPKQIAGVLDAEIEE